MTRTLRPAMIRILLLIAAVAAAPWPATAAPAAEPWPRWDAHDPQSTLAVDHGAWGAFLRRYVVESGDGINRVAYGRVTAADRKGLADYLGRLAAVPVARLSRDAQRALWINLYNALTVKVILDRYPVKSIRDIDISPGLFADGPWGKKLIDVDGVAVSLDDIEHRILRPIWKDPRIHYAVNCASIGCPNLQRTAFTAANAESLLERAARQYVNHPRGAAVADGRLTVSSLYKWYAVDFGGSDGAIIAHLKRFAGPALTMKLEGVRDIADDHYDWALNDAR